MNPHPSAPHPFRTLLAPAVALILVASLGACSSSGTDPQGASSDMAPVPVVASFYPVQWLTEEIGGDAVEVTSLTPEGTEPHDLAVDAQGLKAMGAAEAVLYLGAGFQPDVEKAVASLDDPGVATDLLAGEGVTLLAAPDDIGKETLEGGKDPHVWLDPVLMSAMADGVAERLATVIPGGREATDDQLRTVKQELADLDQTYSSSLKTCKSDALVTSHAAFGYLADRYGLRQIAIAGVSPDDEPDPKQLREVADLAKQESVTTVFFEDALPSDLSRTVADEIGAEIDLLAALEFDPRGSIASDATYVSVMDDNRERIARGLECQA